MRAESRIAGSSVSISPRGADASRRRGPAGCGNAPVRDHVRGRDELPGGVGERRSRHGKSDSPCRVGNGIPSVHRSRSEPFRMGEENAVAHDVRR